MVISLLKYFSPIAINKKHLSEVTSLSSADYYINTFYSNSSSELFHKEKNETKCRVSPGYMS